MTESNQADARADQDALKKAVEAWETVYNENPDDEWARAELKKLYYKSRKWNALVEMLKRETESLPEDAREEKIDILRQLLDINQNRIFADEMVLNTYHRAIFELDPTDADAQLVMEKICKEECRWGDVLKILNDRIDNATDPRRKVELLHEVAVLWTDHLRDSNAAVASFEEILRIEPQDVKALEALKAVYGRQHSWRPLLRLMEKEMEFREGEAKLAVLTEMAEISLKRLQDNDRAARLWRQVLKIDPGHHETLGALEQFTMRQKDWEGFAEMMELRIAHARSEDERIGFLYKLGAVFKDRLVDPARAAKAWERVIELKPGDKRARRSVKESYIASENWPALEKLYVDMNNYKSLAETLGAIAKKADDPVTKETLNLRCVALYEGPIGKPERAMRHYEQVLSVNPQNERAARALAPTYRNRKQWENLFDAVSAIYKSTGELEGLADDTEELTSLASIARDREEWPELVDIKKHIRANEDVVKDKWRVLTYEIGTILDEHLGKRAEAIEAFRELFDRFPGDPDTISFMQNFLYDAEHQLKTAQILMPHLVDDDSWRLQTKAMSILIESTLNADKCLQLQRQLAEIYKQKAGDPYSAFNVLATALKEHPTNRELWDTLTTLAEDLDLSEELAERLGGAYRSWQLDDQSEAELASRLAGILENRLDRPGDAEEFHRRVLKSDPTDETSLQFLANLCIAEERWDEVVILYKDALGSTTDHSERLDLLDKLSIVTDEVLHQVPLAIETYQSILEIDPGNTKAVRALHGLYEEAGRWEDLHRLISSQLKAKKGEEAIAMHCRLSEIEERFLGKPMTALERYKQVLTLKPDNPVAREGLERLVDNRETRSKAAGILKHIYWQRKAMEPLAQMLVIELENDALAGEERITILAQLAALREKHLDDAPGAFETYSKALAVIPGNLPIRAELARLAKQLHIVERYAEVLEGVSNEVDDGKLAAELLSEVARVYHEDLGDVERAEETNRRLLDVAKSEADTVLHAVDMLERVFEERGAWPDLVDVLRIKASHTKDLSEKKEILHRVAETERSKIQQSSKAISTFKEILDFDRKDMRAILGLERLFEYEERWLELIDILRLRSSMEASPKVKREIALRISQLATRLA